MGGTPCTPNQPDPNLDCYAGKFGTSQAAPIVAGVIGLTIASHKDDPDWYDESCPMGERLHAENPQGAVVIQADKDSKNGLLVTVMDAARLAGVDNVSIAAEIID